MQEPQETQVLFLSLKDPLEEKMESHSRIHAWEIPWTEKSGGLQSLGSQKSQTPDLDLATKQQHLTCYNIVSAFMFCFLWL